MLCSGSSLLCASSDVQDRKLICKMRELLTSYLLCTASSALYAGLTCYVHGVHFGPFVMASFLAWFGVCAVVHAPIVGFVMRGQTIWRMAAAILVALIATFVAHACGARPLWAKLVLSIVFLCVSSVALRRRLASHTDETCVCGYCLRGAPGTRCPECGTEIQHRSNPAHPAVPPSAPGR